MLAKRESLPTVESSLDDFIAKANEKLVDVSGFEPENRELAMKREIDDLKKRLSDVETRPVRASAPSIPPLRSSPRWPGILVAFVVGAGSMFAVNQLLPRDEEPATTTAAPRGPEVTPIETIRPPSPAPTQPAAAAPVPAPPDEKPVAPVAAVDTGEKAAANKAAATVRADTKKAHTKRVTKTPEDTQKPPPAQNTGSEGLYNPF